MSTTLAGLFDDHAQAQDACSSDEIKHVLDESGAVDVDDWAQPLAPVGGLRPKPQFGDDVPELGHIAGGYAGPERRVRNDPSYLGSERRWAA